MTRFGGGGSLENGEKVEVFGMWSKDVFRANRIVDRTQERIMTAFSWSKDG
jgi:hypothetical protein